MTDPERCRHRSTLPGPDGDICERCGTAVARPLPTERETARRHIARMRRTVAAARARHEATTTGS